MTNRREFNFRAWNGRSIVYGKPSYIFEQFEGTKSTIMQSTGIFDKNGKEIYEGDVLRYPPKNSVVFWRHEYPCMGFYQGSSGLFFRKKYGWHTGLGTGRRQFFNSMNPYELERDDLEVIGNVFENPDLAGKE